MLPEAEYLYACDREWWNIHLADVRKVFKGKLYTQWHNPEEKDREWAESEGITAIKGCHAKGLGSDRLYFNSNSGAQAINLAYLLGATRIILLGYDMGATGNSHWFGDHPKGLRNGKYEQYVDTFTRLAEDLKRAGVEVINCTRRTALHQFRRAELSAVL
jgi:hypothetical protein